MVALTNLVGAAIGVMVLAIIIFSVAVPVVKESISCASLSGTESTIANLVPLFMILGVFMIIVAIFVTRWI